MATVNLFVRGEVIINGETQTIGDLFNPVALTASAGVMTNSELALSGAATTQIYSASNAAVVIICQASVAGTYCWRGTNGDDDNNSVVVPANFPIVITGTTNDYANTTAGRLAATEALVSAISFEHGGSGTMKVWAIR